MDGNKGGEKTSLTSKMWCRLNCEYWQYFYQGVAPWKGLHTFCEQILVVILCLSAWEKNTGRENCSKIQYDCSGVKYSGLLCGSVFTVTVLVTSLTHVWYEWDEKLDREEVVHKEAHLKGLSIPFWNWWQVWMLSLWAQGKEERKGEALRVLRTRKAKIDQTTTGEYFWNLLWRNNSRRNYLTGEFVLSYSQWE